jgi:MFS family permease
MSVDLILLFVSLFTWGIGEGLFFVFQPIYLGQLGADTMTIASVYSAFGAAMMVAHIPAGYLADRIGRKPLLIAAWASGLVATWVMALARTLPVFIFGMLMYGLTAFVSSPLNSYVTAARGKLNPARAMTLMSASFNLGAIIGPISGGWIGDHIGLRTVYFIAACLFIVSTVILFFLHSQPRDHHDPSAPPARLLSNTRFIGFLFISFFVMFVTYLPQPLTARFLENERSLSLGSIGLLGSINGFGNALFNLLLGFLSSRLGLVLVQICVAFFTLLIWRGTGLGWYMLGYFILGGYRAARAFIFSLVRSLTHPSQMGLAFGFAETFNSLAVVLAPLLAGVLYTRDPLMVYWVSLVLIGAAILVSVIAVPGGKAAMPSAAPVDIHTPPME